MTENLSPAEQIKQLLAEAEAKISEAEGVADKYGKDFYWGGASYGMGGYYRATYESSDEDWEQSDAGWQASSQSC